MKSVSPRDRFTIEDKTYEVYEVFLGEDGSRWCKLREIFNEEDFLYDREEIDENELVCMSEEDLLNL